MLARVVALSSWVAVAWGDRPADVIESLPGFPDSDFPTLPKMWSGYIEHAGVGGDVLHTHYWMVQNANKSSTAHTIAWQNGGPGSSGLIGLLTENGPVTLNDDSFNTEAYNKSGVPSVFVNPHSWHTEGNMVYIDHPSPTGFSYCAGVCAWNDSSQAVALYNFYVAFFEAFPELASNDFFITGESYAGVMVPMGALEILKAKNAGNANKAPWSLKGLVLGNDCIGAQDLTCTPYSGWAGTKVALDFRYYHALISEETYNKVNAACEGHYGTVEAPPEPCKSLLENPIDPVNSETGTIETMGGGYFLYDTCPVDDQFRTTTLTPIGVNASNLMAESNVIPDRRSWKDRAAMRPAYNLTAGEYACGQQTAGLVWLNLPQTQALLHVELKGKPSFSWGVGLQYDENKASLRLEYANTLIPNLYIMQYSGDSDPCVPFVGTQRWINSLNMTATTAWHPWMTPGIASPSGYATQYGNNNNFTFVTVKGSGHMVPRFKPAQAHQMIKGYFAGGKF
ncbi:Serine carboxypeptidase-like 21 [Diplonema papillatum]|nr:Serine carboxypeptidase-like 21 [Diplonema papillatum]|eukprot:gene3462-5420_t